MLTATSVTFGYGRKAIASDVSLSLNVGQVTAVLGTNGSGKSTLVKTLLGLQAPVSGKIVWTEKRPNPIAYLSQLTDFDRTFPMNVHALVASGAWGQRRKGLATPEKIAAALDRVELSHCAAMPVHELSGGQLQRARFARAIVQDAPLIVLDEPFAAVDQRREESLLHLIQDWAVQEGRAVLLVLHDLSSALRVCENALLMGEGGADFGPTEEILRSERLVARGYMSQTQVDLMHQAAHAADGPVHMHDDGSHCHDAEAHND